jgi:triacylglycerol lipase
MVEEKKLKINTMTKDEVLYNVQLCDVVYKDQKDIDFNHYGLTSVKWIDDKKTDTQAFIAMKGKSLYVVFRGTSSKKDAQNDVSIDKVPFIVEGDKVHIGFKSSWDGVKEIVLKTIHKMTGRYDKIVVCGHSLGAAVATLCAYNLSHVYNDPIECCTIGSPRVGNKTFKNNYDSRKIKTLRIVHNNDVVTHSPFIGYYHVNYMLRIDNEGNIKKFMIDWERAWNYIKSMFTGKNIKDHMTDGYISSLNKWYSKQP